MSLVMSKVMKMATLALLLCACGAATPQSAPLPSQPVDAGATLAISPAGELTFTVQLDTASGDEAILLAQGEALYQTNCAPCHQANGEGNIAIFPALNRNAFVTVSDPTGVINTVLFGRQVMPAFAATLNAEDASAVISYIRNAWDNEASLVDSEQVRERANARQQTR
jgi:mono/diheme cytochrome c family protein